jgi:hypothetical protein
MLSVYKGDLPTYPEELGLHLCAEGDDDYVDVVFRELRRYRLERRNLLVAERAAQMADEAEDDAPAVPEAAKVHSLRVIAALRTAHLQLERLQRLHPAMLVVIA